MKAATAPLEFNAGRVFWLTLLCGPPVGGVIALVEMALFSMHSPDSVFSQLEDASASFAIMAIYVFLLAPFAALFGYLVGAIPAAFSAFTAVLIGAARGGVSRLEALAAGFFPNLIWVEIGDDPESRLTMLLVFPVPAALAMMFVWHACRRNFRGTRFQTDTALAP